MRSTRNRQILTEAGEGLLGGGSFFWTYIANEESTAGLILGVIAFGIFCALAKANWKRKEIDKTAERQQTDKVIQNLIDELLVEVTQGEKQITQDNEEATQIIEAAVESVESEKTTSLEAITMTEEERQIAQRVKARTDQAAHDRKTAQAFSAYKNASPSKRKELEIEYKDKLKSFKHYSYSPQSTTKKPVSQAQASVSEEKKQTTVINMPSMELQPHYKPQNEFLTITGNGVFTTGSMGLFFYNILGSTSTNIRWGVSVPCGIIFGAARAFVTNTDQRVEYDERKRSEANITKLKSIRAYLKTLNEQKRLQSETLNEIRTVFGKAEQVTESKAQNTNASESTGRKQRSQSVKPPLVAVLQEPTAAIRTESKQSQMALQASAAPKTESMQVQVVVQESATKVQLITAKSASAQSAPVSTSMEAKKTTPKRPASPLTTARGSLSAAAPKRPASPSLPGLLAGPEGLPKVEVNIPSEQKIIKPIVKREARQTSQSARLVGGRTQPIPASAIGPRGSALVAALSSGGSVASSSGAAVTSERSVTSSASAALVSERSTASSSIAALTSGRALFNSPQQRASAGPKPVRSNTPTRARPGTPTQLGKR